MNTIDIVDAVFAQDKDSFMSAFNSAMASKITDALELKKVELASTLLSPETIAVETTDETNEITTEVDGAESFSNTVEN